MLLDQGAASLPCSKSPLLPTAEPFALQWPQQLNASLEEVDPDLYDIIEKEKNRQYKVLHALCCDYITVFGRKRILLTIPLWQTKSNSIAAGCVSVLMRIFRNP